MTLPPDGIYPGVPFAEYHKWDAASHSRLCDLARSPAYCRLRTTTPDASTTAKDSGTVVHALVLEGTIDGRYHIKDYDARSTENKAKLQAAKDAGLLVVTPDELRDAQAIAASVLAHRRASALTAKAARREVSIVWTDPTTGIRCKARPDAMADVRGRRILVDLKRVRTAHPDDFPRGMLDLDIDSQMAWYRDGLRALGWAPDDVVIVAVLPDAPHEVWCHRLADDVLTRGVMRNEKAVKVYAECVRTGVWPGGSEDVVEADLPEWEKRRVATLMQVEQFNEGGELL